MRALLDVNVLLALMDQAHVHHLRAKGWFLEQAPLGWASCPLTQNGFIRVISQPRYPKPIGTSAAIKLLSDATGTEYHEFWPADLSLLDTTKLDHSLVHGPSQLTDLYLLAVAVHKGGCLATLDTTIPWQAVRGATSERVLLI